MRPRGSYGEVAQALCTHAAEPRSVADLASRACVGTARARYTVSRLVDAGELVVIDGGRPMQVVRRDAAPQAATAPDGLVELEAAMRAFWDSG